MAQTEVARDLNRELTVAIGIARTAGGNGERAVTERAGSDVGEICAVDSAAVRDDHRTEGREMSAQRVLFRFETVHAEARELRRHTCHAEASFSRASYRRTHNKVESWFNYYIRPPLSQAEERLAGSFLGGNLMRHYALLSRASLFASAYEFPGGQLLRGAYVTDRVLHPLYHCEKEGNRRRFNLDAAGMVKKTIDIETK